MDTGHWSLKEGIIITDETFGFLYRITNVSVTPPKEYIGKKQKLTKLKRKPLKGKKNKRISIVDTDWKTYMGSCFELLEDIEKLGKENFTFEIIKTCNSKSELMYEEIRLQILEEVLFRKNSYNGIISCRLGKNCFKKQLREV